MTRLFAFAGFLFVCLSWIAVTPAPSAAQTTIPNIQNDAVSTWQWCNSCASASGSTYAVGGVASVTQSGYQISGKSVRFDLIDNGTLSCSPNCYGNVYFWNPVASDISETSVTNDFYAMMNSVGDAASQALEFTVEHDICKANCGQSNEEDFRYIFSVQCDFNSKVWRLWDGAAYSTGGNAWQPTSYACDPFQAMSFNHFTFDFTRGNQEVTYVDMWINGVQYSFNNTTYGIQYDTPNSKQQFVASVQLDGDYNEAPYSMWVDEWNITYK
jgi:hypothetical protein